MKVRGILRLPPGGILAPLHRVIPAEAGIQTGRLCGRLSKNAINPLAKGLCPSARPIL
jgi:hypothetical protein